MANLLMPLQIERQYGASLDANYSFDTLEELKKYATTSALSYSGQILYCKENDTLYKVNNDKTDVGYLGGGAAIDDTTTSLDSTWSSEKIANNYSTKEYVAEQISNAVHLVKEIVDEIPLAENAKENVIYMIKDDTVTSGDIYKEYQLINGEVVQTGDTSIDLTEYAKTTEIPTKVSQLENDSNYLSSIPEEYVTDTELEAKGYITEHQDISGKVDKVEGKSLISDTEIARLASVDNYDDTSIREELANKADTTSIPSKVSELTNDSNYQTAEQVNSTVTTEIAKVVADAPEDFNTLKEMSDWIAGHEDDASAMNSAISDNKTNIETLQTDVSNITTSLDNKVDKTELEDIQASGVKISKSDGTKKSLQGMYEDGELGGGVEIDDSKSSSDTTYSSSKIVELTSKYAMSFNSSTGKLSITLK